MPARKKPYFSVLITYWNREQQHTHFTVTEAIKSNDSVLLMEILRGMSKAEIADLAKISAAQMGGRAVPWLAEFLRENPDHRGGYAWYFGGEHLIKSRKVR